MAGRIKITFKKGGQVEVKTEGFKGTGCKAISKALQDALGSTSKDVATSEQFETPPQNQQRLGLGGH